MPENEGPKDETGAELEDDGRRRNTGNIADEQHPVPLFLRDRNDGRQENAQDEKSETSE